MLETSRGRVGADASDAGRHAPEIWVTNGMSDPEATRQRRMSQHKDGESNKTKRQQSRQREGGFNKTKIQAWSNTLFRVMATMANQALPKH